MAKILVHITHGPESPTRAALGFLVARSAAQEGHEVTLFLAGDAVQLIRPAVLDNLAGLGTGKLREHFEALVERGCRFYLSGMSAQSRGLEVPKGGSSGQPEYTPAMPDVLVRLSLESDRMFTY